MAFLDDFKNRIATGLAQATARNTPPEVFTNLQNSFQNFLQGARDYIAPPNVSRKVDPNLLQSFRSFITEKAVDVKQQLQPRFQDFLSTIQQTPQYKQASTVVENLNPSNLETPVLGGIRRFQQESAQEAIQKYNPKTSITFQGRQIPLSESQQYAGTPTGAMDVGFGGLPIGAGFSRTPKNVEVLDSLIQSAKSQEEAVFRLGALFDRTKEAFSQLFKASPDEAVQRLKSSRAAIAQVMQGMAGSGGAGYKSDYALLQTMKENPDTGKIISLLEDHVSEIDTLLKKNILTPAQEAARRKLPGIMYQLSPDKEKLQPLAEEARKYKDAEKFISGRYGKLVHSPEADLFDIQTMEKSNAEVFRNALKREGLTEEKRGFFKKEAEMAEKIVKDAEELRAMEFKTYGDFYTQATGEKSLNFVKEMADESRRIKDPRNISQPLEDIVNNTFNEVKKKVNALDYLRTPNRVLEKIGLGNEAKLLRKQYDAYLGELPKEIDKITAWSKRVSSDANVRIFRYLDGKLPQLDNPAELQVANEIKAYLKDWAIKLNLPEDRQISKYITHLFPKGAIEKEFDPEVAKLIRSKVAESVYDPFLQKRINMPDYLEDTWQALDAYTKRATRKYYMDTALEQIAQKAENLPLESYNYVKGRIARINMQPTEIDNLLDIFVKSSPIGYKLGQRPTTAVTQIARRMVYRALLGLNPLAALRNLQQTTNTYSVLGEKYFGVGLMKTIQNLPRFILGKDTELEAAGVLGKDIVQDRTISATKKFWENADNVLFYMFNLAEKWNRGVAYFGAKTKALSQGMNETQALEYAKDIVGKTQFYYDVIDTPAFLQSDITKTLFQFGKYPLAQTEFLVEMVKNKSIAGSLRYIVSNLLFVATVGKILGLEPQDMFPQFRFGSPPALQLPAGVFQAATQGEDKYGNPLSPTERIFNKDVQRGALNYVPAGGQLRRMYEGATSSLEGGSYTPSGKLRYPVEGNLRNLLFGIGTSREAQDYYSSGSPFGDRQTELYRQLISAGLSPQEAYQKIADQRTQEEAFKKDIQSYAPSQGFFDALGQKLDSLFGRNPSVQPQGDLIVNLYKRQKEDSDNTAKIKDIMELGLGQQVTEALLSKYNLGTYQDAQFVLLKSLGVGNGARGQAVKSLLSGLSSEQYVEITKVLTERGILTSGVIEQLVKDGEIGVLDGERMKALTKRHSGKLPKAKRFPLPRPTMKKVSFKFPKAAKTKAPTLPRLTFKPLVPLKARKIKEPVLPRGIAR